MKRTLTARKTTPGVRRGRVKKKNRVVQKPPQSQLAGPRIVRRRPREGTVHVVDGKDVRRFLTMLPEWEGLVGSLSAVVLDSHNPRVDATYPFERATITLQAWPNGYEQRWGFGHVDDHMSILSRLGVSMEEAADSVICRFTRDGARAYVLLHVLMHELGHHMHWTTRRIRSHDRAEAIAEELALRFEWLLWQRYVDCFGDPRPA